MTRAASLAWLGLLVADVTEAEGSKPFRASRESHLNLIRVGDERHEVPDAAILGG